MQNARRNVKLIKASLAGRPPRARAHLIAGESKTLTVTIGRRGWLRRTVTRYRCDLCFPFHISRHYESLSRRREKQAARRKVSVREEEKITCKKVFPAASRIDLRVSSIHTRNVLRE